MGQDSDSGKDVVEDMDIDEGWDDLDDEFSDDFIEDEDAFSDDDVIDEDDLDSPSAPKKSGSGKTVVFGLLALAILGGGAWFALNGHLVSMKKPSNVTPTVSLESKPSDNSTVSLMESPENSDSNLSANKISPQDSNNLGTGIGIKPEQQDIAPAEPQDQASQKVSVSSPAEAEPGVLTPMPDLGTLSKESDSQLPDLNASDNTDTSSADVSSSDEAPLTMDDNLDIAKNGDNTSVDLTLDDDSQSDVTPTEVPSLKPSEKKVSDRDTAEPAISLEENKFMSETEKQFVPSEETTERSLQPKEPVSSPPPALSNKTVQKVEASDVSDTEGKDDRASDISKPSSENGAPTVEKEKNVSVSPSKQETKAIASPSSSQDAVKSATAEQASPSTQVKETKPKPQVKTAPAVPPPVWELRSASTNMAVLFDKRRGLSQSVSVGSVVNGLGRIKSIKIVDHKWVVEGTSGRVSQ